MSHHRPPLSRPRRAARRRRIAIGSTLAVAAVAAVTVGVVVTTGDDGPSRAEPVPTGEVNAMGMPVIRTPGVGTNPTSVGPLEVDHSIWELGTVPLNTAVRPQWSMRNTGTEPVLLGEPRPEVRAGCCPGPIELSTRTIPPGGTATLVFELSMHPGMDGWHDIVIDVPISDAAGDGVVSLEVTGDFRDA